MIISEIISALSKEIDAREVSGIGCDHLKEAIKQLSSFSALQNALRTYATQRDLLIRRRPEYEDSNRINEMLEKAALINKYMRGK